MAQFDRDAGRRFLCTLGEILDRLAVPFFLIQGTALGAYRDRDFTPTERDIDLGFLMEDFAPRAGDVVKALVERDIEVVTWHRHKPFSYCHTIVAFTNGAHADLVGFHRWKDSRFAVTPDDPVNVPKPYAIVHNRALLENCGVLTLFGRLWRVPYPVEAYLAAEYGADWQTPFDSHVSKARIYDYLKKEGIPDVFFQTKPT